MIDDNRDPESGPEQREEGFLARWSKRKRGVDSESAGSNASVEPPSAGADAAAMAELENPAGADSEVITDDPVMAETAASPTELPALDSLDENSDYRGFLSPEVDEKLQRLALRKLFSSAGFNIRDGLDDYDDDFTFFEPLGNVVTADMRHQAEVEARREEARRLAAGEDRPDAESAETVAERDDSPPGAAADTKAEDGDPEDAQKRMTSIDPDTTSVADAAPTGQDRASLDQSGENRG